MRAHLVEEEGHDPGRQDGVSDVNVPLRPQLLGVAQAVFRKKTDTRQTPRAIGV